ncbi:MAG: patatin-like phospholipase family protein [Rhizobiales bacterium]|nr:patatin-like phospholipase family protein [Hyphomicrobiales bacterium]
MATAFFVFAGIFPPAIELQAAKQRTPSAAQKKEAPPPPQRAPLPPREPFTVEQQATAVIPGMPDVRFWSDSEADFIRALPALPGPWLILSTGGGDGAFGAGLLNGWTETGKRPSFSVVTGVSAGALMAPYAFAGSQYDKQLKDSYTSINAGDVFELGGRGESLLDTWPLKDLIAKWVTPQLVADIAIEHNRGRRLFILTTNLDAERFVVWNIGAIAARGGEPALNLIRQVLLASASIPGAFPPVLINVQAGSVRFQEMHADGGLGAQFFVAPERMLASTSTYKLPATELFIIVNTGLTRDFIITERTTITVLGRAVSAAIKAAIRVLIDRTYTAAKRSGVGFNLAYVEPSFQHESHGAFDPDYMKALFAFGEEKGRKGNYFHEPPDYANPHNTGAPMK